MDIVPIVARLVVPIKEKDEQFMQIQELINAKENLLIEKQKKLRFISKQNRFLEVVRNDYNKYYNYIHEQKKDQIRALQLLDEYIRDLTMSGKLTKHNIEDAKEEQSKILKEIKHIKNSLESMIDNTKEVQDALNMKIK
jgi:hypothetical protein